MTTAPDTSASPYVFTTVQTLREHLCRHFERGNNFHRNGSDLYANIPELCGRFCQVNFIVTHVTLCLYACNIIQSLKLQ